MLNYAHLHITINHIPVILTPLVLCLLVYGAWRHNATVQRVGLAIGVVSALGAGASQLTGKSAATIIRNVPDAASFSHDTIRTLISHHDDAATYTIILTGALGVLGLFGLWQYRRSPTLPRWLAAAGVVLAVVASLSIAWTAFLGGEIRHPEARPGFIAPPDTTRGS